MMSSSSFHLPLRFIFLAFLLSATTALAQQQQEASQKSSFYDVQITRDEIYKYEKLKFTGDYTSFESPSGLLALGRTEVGVTIVIVLGAGTAAIDCAEAAREKFKAVFGSYPLKISFNWVYMRLHPKEFEEGIGKMPLTKTPDEAALAKAKEIFDLKFLASYHAGPRAILPPEKTRVMEFDTTDIGQIYNEEGYWLFLRRISPYGSIYPARFVNPKQK